MYLLYVDEAGDTGKPPPRGNSQTRNYVLTGLAIHEGQWYKISRKVESVQKKYFPQSRSAVEFHIKNIKSGKGAFALFDPTTRDMLVNDLVRLLKKHKHGPVFFACVIDKCNYEEPPLLTAFEEICNRFDLFLKRLAAHGDKQKGLIIFDRTTLAERLKREINKYRESGTRWGVIINIIETILLPGAEESRLLQLADVFASGVVFPFYEHNADKYWKLLFDKFDREPIPGGRLHGLAHKTRNRDCHCPACRR